MTLHILGICGTFMGGVAALARELGETVAGSDQNVYPPNNSVSPCCRVIAPNTCSRHRT